MVFLNSLRFSLGSSVCNHAEESQHDEFHLENCSFLSSFSIHLELLDALVCRTNRILCHIWQKFDLIYGFHTKLFFPVFLVALSTGDSLGSFVAFLSLTRVSAEGIPLPRGGHPRSKVQVHSTRTLSIPWNSPRSTRAFD